LEHEKLACAILEYLNTILVAYETAVAE